MTATVHKTDGTFHTRHLLFVLMLLTGCSADLQSAEINGICVRSASEDGQLEIAISTIGNTPQITRNVDCGVEPFSVNTETQAYITPEKKSDWRQLSISSIVYEPPQEIVARIPSDFKFNEGDSYLVRLDLPLGYTIYKKFTYSPGECAGIVTDTDSDSTTETAVDDTGNERATETIHDTDDSSTNPKDTITDEDTTAMVSTDTEVDSDTGSAIDTEKDSSSDNVADSLGTDRLTDTDVDTKTDKGIDTATRTDTNTETGTNTNANTDTETETVSDSETTDILSVTALKEYFQDAEYTSGRLNSNFEVPNDPGTVVEARLKLALGGCSESSRYMEGSWVAFWLLGSNSDEQGYGGTVPWPECGEIVIVEWIGQYGDTYYTTNQSGSPAFDVDHNEPSSIDFSSGPEDWHIYGVRFNGDTITFTFDGEDMSTKNYDDADDHTHRILLNLAIGGDLGGVVGENFVEEMLQVDWVRVTGADGELLWADEMNDETFTRAHWFPFVGMAYNNELQYYTNWAANNFRWHGDYSLGACD